MRGDAHQTGLWRSAWGVAWAMKRPPGELLEEVPCLAGLIPDEHRLIMLFDLCDDGIHQIVGQAHRHCRWRLPV